MQCEQGSIEKIGPFLTAKLIALFLIKTYFRMGVGATPSLACGCILGKLRVAIYGFGKMMEYT